MVSPLVAQPAAPTVGERRVTFRNLDWHRYQTIRQALGATRVSRSLAHLQGVFPEGKR